MSADIKELAGDLVKEILADNLEIEIMFDGDSVEVEVYFDGDKIAEGRSTNYQ